MYLDIILLLLGTGDSTLRINSSLCHYIHNYFSHHLLQRHCYHCHDAGIELTSPPISHYLVECLYPELILICATLVFSLGLSHARRVAQIFWERGWKYLKLVYLCLCWCSPVWYWPTWQRSTITWDTNTEHRVLFYERDDLTPFACFSGLPSPHLCGSCVEGVEVSSVLGLQAFGCETVDAPRGWWWLCQWLCWWWWCDD